MTGRGRGFVTRGDLIQKLTEQAASKAVSGDGSSSESSQGAESSERSDERKIGHSTTSDLGKSIATTTTPTITGRGRLLQAHSVVGSTSSSSSGGGGQGRAALLKSLRSRSSAPTPPLGDPDVSPSERSAQSDPASSVVASTSISRGRGRILEMMRAPILGKEEFLQRTTDETKEDVQKRESQIKEITQKVGEIVLEQEGHDPEPVIRKGTHGTPATACTNYIRLKSDPNKGVYVYEVKFKPNIDSRNERMKYLNEHRDKYGGTKTFDGVTLYLPVQLPDKITKYYSINPTNDAEIEVSLHYKFKKSLGQCIQLYNVLFNRIMKTLHFVQFDRKHYDPTAPQIIPQHRLEIWPGYVTAVDLYEDGIMLCCDVSHRLLCQKTVLDALREAYHASPNQFQDTAKKALIGSVVLTRYNNKTYRIDDIDFNSNPTSTFKTNSGDITYLEYYKTHYNIDIQDKKQPLLISIKSRRVANKPEPEELTFCLIPEICNLTGIRDDMRADFKVMRDIATHTRITPNQRVAALRKFYTNINNCKEAREILSNWGLSIDNTPEKVLARQLDEEVVFFNNRQYPVGPNADFGRQATNNELLEVINITNWLLIHTRNDMRFARSFMDFVEKCGRPMGMQIAKPRVQILNDDRTETYVNALRGLIKPDVQIVVLICPTSRDDRYAAIKKICCAEVPIPSQVINSRTLSRDDKNRAIVQKIILQMNCKLGGTLWSVKIPFKNVMICGIDTYHDATKTSSVSAFVGSINNAYTKWYSKAVIQQKKEELVNGLCASLKYALQAYKKYNNCLPEKIIIFRDGVGDGQLKLCEEYELPHLKDACATEGPGYSPAFTFVVVQKRINTKLFFEASRDNYENPRPGFVLDHTVTRRYMYDYFLVSQSVRQGTVSPTHFVVVSDEASFSPDILQRLSYKLCFLYYNWPGTVRVPACCQYAHKLAYLVGQSIKRPTSEKLSDKLFYL